MKTINLAKDYHFTTEPADEGSYTDLLLTMEEGKVTLYRYDSDLEYEDCICAQGTLDVLKELVSSIIWYYSHNRYELGDVYDSALSFLVSKIFSQEEIKHLMKVFNMDFTVDLVETLLNQGKLDWLQEL